MRLSWMRIYEVSDKKMKAEVLRQQQRPFPDTVKEIHAALKNEFKIAFIRNDRITLLKYNNKEGEYSALAVEGAELEIIALQEDEIIKNSLF